MTERHPSQTSKVLLHPPTRQLFVQCTSNALCCAQLNSSACSEHEQNSVSSRENKKNPLFPGVDKFKLSFLFLMVRS